ncbi:MAG: response regulator transcription factor [Bacteroidales bacterium]|nr:response regulator transcription factor [Bacteroidales bacterium]
MQRKIIIIDDQNLFATGLKSLLEEIDNVKVIKIIPDGSDIVFKLNSPTPDVLLLDLNLPVKNGIQILEEIRPVFPEMIIAILTMYSDENLAMMTKKLGANAYLNKDADLKELKHVIFEIDINDFYLGNGIKKVTQHESLIEDKFSHINQLTSREKEIIKLIAEGKSSSEVAEDLFISPATVQTHRRNIFNKLKVNKVSELIKYAYQNNII